MPNIQLKIYSRIVGASPQQPPLDPVLVELLKQQITVAELIRRVVEEQIRHLTHKRQLNSTEVQLALARQYLSAEEGRIRLKKAGSGCLLLYQNQRNQQLLIQKPKSERHWMRLKRPNTLSSLMERLLKASIKPSALTSIPRFYLCESLHS
jgi:hypothetical protein